MKKLWEKNPPYNAIKLWADCAIRLSFSGFKVEGLENIPKGEPVIIAPNHCCTLMDPLVVVLSRRGPTAFGARADIFKNPTAYKLLHLLRMVPLARARDGMRDVAGNYKTFDEISDCIGHGVPFCMFVEGTHRPERGLQPIKNGIFKLAALAEEKIGKPVHIVPAGIAYESFFDFMGDVVLRYGKPITLADYADQHEIREALSDQIFKLQEQYPRHKALPLALSLPLMLLSLPLFALAFAFSWPMLLVETILISKSKDRAWRNSLRVCTYFIMVPVLLLIMLLAMVFTCPWWVTLSSALGLLFGHSIYYRLRKFYCSTIKSLKK